MCLLPFLFAFLVDISRRQLRGSKASGGVRGSVGKTACG